MKPTMMTVAEALGVSRTTVSNAYNRPDQLTAELRERVLAVADELGYAGPHPNARSLRTGTTGAIGVLLTGSLANAFRDPTAVAFLRGISEAGEDEGLSVLLVPAPADATTNDAVASASVDGFIVYSVPAGHPVVERVRDRRQPIVTVDEPDFGRDQSAIGIDDAAGASMAARHLLDLGHRRLAVIAMADHGALAGSAVSARRMAGYQSAMVGAGLPADLPTVTAPENSPAGARDAAAELLDRCPEVTGVLAMSDQLALGLLHEAASRHIAIPTDISVVGFDDIPRAAVSQPPLTTVRQPLFEKGKLALRLLTDQTGPLRVELPVEFVERSSTGAPRPT